MEVLHGGFGALQSVCSRTLQALFASPSTCATRRICGQRTRHDAALSADKLILAAASPATSRASRPPDSPPSASLVAQAPLPKSPVVGLLKPIQRARRKKAPSMGSEGRLAPAARGVVLSSRTNRRSNRRSDHASHWRGTTHGAQGPSRPGAGRPPAPLPITSVSQLLA